MPASYFVSIVEDPAFIRMHYPDGAPWDGDITPRIHVMMDGDPRNDPESGEFVIPRVRDPRFTRSAALIALRPEILQHLNAEVRGGSATLSETLGLCLYASREEAFLAHPELEWQMLGKFAGVDF